jgi:hypothetical protein
MVPKKTFEAIQDWIAKGTHPSQLGSFVRAVLTNDLRTAVGKADEENLAALKEIVGWVYWNVPSGIYGTELALLAYHEHKLAERERFGKVA